MKKPQKKPISTGVAKVPVVMQLEVLECGAASLGMILAYYGKWIPLEKLRADCGVSRDGSNAKNVLIAARSYGLTAKGYRYEPEDLRKTGNSPALSTGISTISSCLTDSGAIKPISTTPPKEAIRFRWRISTKPSRAFVLCSSRRRISFPKENRARFFPLLKKNSRVRSGRSFSLF